MKHYLNLNIEDVKGEEWVDCLGYDGIYMVSNMGRIKSYQREINMGKQGVRVQPERIMRQHVSKCNVHNLKELSKSLKVTFHVDGVRKTLCIPTIVGLGFVGNLEPNQVYSKKNKRWDDCRAKNLEIKTVSDSTKISYKKGNNLRKKKCLTKNHVSKFIWKRLIDGKCFTSSELVTHYKREVRGNIIKGIKNNKKRLGSFWERMPIKTNPV